jgi:hypothetical protein
MSPKIRFPRNAIGRATETMLSNMATEPRPEAAKNRRWQPRQPRHSRAQPRRRDSDFLSTASPTQEKQCPAIAPEISRANPSRSHSIGTFAPVPSPKTLQAIPPSFPEQFGRSDRQNGVLGPRPLCSLQATIPKSPKLSHMQPPRLVRRPQPITYPYASSRGRPLRPCRRDFRPLQCRRLAGLRSFRSPCPCRRR